MTEHVRQKPIKALLLSLLIWCGGIGLTILIFTTEPQAEREGAVKKSAMLVDVFAAEWGDFEPKLSAMGVVRPAREIELQTRVMGKITAVSAAFTPGGFLKTDEMIVQIDPKDYEQQIHQAESQVARAEAELELEIGRQNVAKNDFTLFEDTIPEQTEDLVLRRPQLKIAQANLRAAEAELEMAQLNLERTTISAPFPAQMVERYANLGSHVGVGEALGRMIGLETFWVEVSVPVKTVAWLDFHENYDEHDPVIIHHSGVWAPDEKRQGYLFRMINELDNDNRMARVLVAVDDPMAQTPGHTGPPLLAGSFVEAEIPIRRLTGVARIPRDYIRKNSTVWLAEDGKLAIRSVKIIFQDRRHAYISDGLKKGDQVIVTNVSRPKDGTAVRINEVLSPAETADTSTASKPAPNP